MTRVMAALLGAALLLAGCKDSTGSRAGPAAKMDVVSGNAQTGPAGAELPQPVVVKVTDAKGRAVKGQAVNFVVTAGGGSVSAGTALTNDEGVAQGRWTLGTVAGAPQTLEARAVDSSTGQTLVLATFTATATGGAPAQIAALNGDTLVSGVISSEVYDTLAVVVRDAFGNAVAGAAVTWSVTTGGGTVTAVSATTDAAGVARARWVLGAEVLAQHRAQATVAGVGTVRFSALVATHIHADTQPIVTGATGQPAGLKSVGFTGPGGFVPDLPVVWSLTGGGSANPPVVRTNVNGTAVTTWTLGPTPGNQTLTATAGQLSATFTALAIATATRTVLAQVPGRVLDADGTRVLWVDTMALPAWSVKVRTGGTDVVVLSGESSFLTGFRGWLFPGGALVNTPQFALWEYRNGASTQLAASVAPVVDGSWAVWQATSLPTALVRRSLATGTNDTIPITASGVRRIDRDVGPNGDVVYNLYYGGNGGGANELYRYRNGTSTLLHSGFSLNGLELLTDGVNVLFERLPGSGNELWLVPPSGIPQRLVVRGSSNFQPEPHGLVAGGWVVYLDSPNGFVARLISPSGAFSTVSTPGPVYRLEALATDGSVVYQGGNAAVTGPTRRYLTRPGGAPADVGPITAEAGGVVDRPVFVGSRLLLLVGNTVYEVTGA